ncbi:ArsR/SmtB family transcription factor [Deinococcus hopiensis]|uniref:DNA-binding transcriptional regulator, ArsR family n=1 Tax=Deinococcus hopiensis KR-140 TaxID=695939 RepID=A0A1W1UUA3_9DEIO|nr:metalloregulator ArsR/SmtB family transcription factor [Deinococcus hopiensis]SMB84294.1 DNA-binding transcriptional regulator, ArsR family [Deinococcus hopiensis KR-140]
MTGIFPFGYNCLNQKEAFLNAATFSALAEPHRLHIVELLIQQPLTVGEIASRLDLRQPQASKHLKVLSDAGIIEVQAQANRRICSLRPEPFQDLDAWLSAYRTLWEGRFDRLESYLRELQTIGPTTPTGGPT